MWMPSPAPSSAASIRRRALKALKICRTIPTFVLAANHYQRKGLWILFPAAVLTQVIRQRYGPENPPVRWMVTANWPRVRVGPLSLPSPGDVLLPRVADALACYPVSFAGSNQAFTARSLRRILREAPRANRPLGIFPEGVGGSAGVFTKPIPGVERLLNHLAKAGMPVVPVCISEFEDRLIFRIGAPISTSELISASNAADLVLARIQIATLKEITAGVRIGGQRKIGDSQRKSY